MPCTISREEERYYERMYNKASYGKDWTSAQLTTAVACYLADLLKDTGELEYAPLYVKGWIEQHKLEDKERA